MRRLITLTMAGLTIIAFVAAWYGLSQASNLRAAARKESELTTKATKAASDAATSLENTKKAKHEIEQLVQYLMFDLGPGLQGKAAMKEINYLEEKVVTYYEETAGSAPSADRLLGDASQNANIGFSR